MSGPVPFPPPGKPPARLDPLPPPKSPPPEEEVAVPAPPPKSPPPEEVSPCVAGNADGIPHALQAPAVVDEGNPEQHRDAGAVAKQLSSDLVGSAQIDSVRQWQGRAQSAGEQSAASQLPEASGDVLAQGAGQTEISKPNTAPTPADERAEQIETAKVVLAPTSADEGAGQNIMAKLVLAPVSADDEGASNAPAPACDADAASSRPTAASPSTLAPAVSAPSQAVSATVAKSDTSHPSQSYQRQDSAKSLKDAGDKVIFLNQVTNALKEKTEQEPSEELEELQMKSMKDIVEDVVLRNTGRANLNKLLYLTHAQAIKVDLEAMPKIIAELGLGDVELVVVLLSASKGATFYQNRSCMWRARKVTVQKAKSVPGLRVRWCCPPPAGQEPTGQEAIDTGGSWGQPIPDKDSSGQPIEDRGPHPENYLLENKRWKKRVSPNSKSESAQTYPGAITRFDEDKKLCWVRWDDCHEEFEYRIGAWEQYDLVYEGYSEAWYLSDTQEDQIERQIDLFLRESLLPLTVNYRALVISQGLNKCSLAVRAGSACKALKARLGQSANLSFLAIVNAERIYRQAMYGGSSSIARALREGSEAVNGKFKFHPEYEKHVSFEAWDDGIPKMAMAQNWDFVEGITHYVVVEDLDRTDPTNMKREKAGYIQFRNTLLHSLQSKRSTLAVASCTVDGTLPGLADVALRGVPLLLLDVFPRCRNTPRMQLVHPGNVCLGLLVRRSLQWKGRDADGGARRVESFPGRVVSDAKKSEGLVDVRWNDPWEKDRISVHKIGKDGIFELFCEGAARGLEKSMTSAVGSPVRHSSRSRLPGASFDAADEDIDDPERGLALSSGSPSRAVPHTVSISQKQDEFEKQIMHLARPRDLKQYIRRIAKDLWQISLDLECWMSSRGVATDLMDDGVNGVMHAILHDISTLSALRDVVSNLCKTEVLDTEEVPLWYALSDIERNFKRNNAGARERGELATILADWFVAKANELARDGWALSYENTTPKKGWGSDASQVWNSVRDLLMTPTVRAANAFDLEECNKALRLMADVDRLPERNSPEALSTLRSLWDTVDVCAFVAERNKALAKVCYLTLLFFVLATAIVATLTATGDIQKLASDEVSRAIVMALGLLNTFAVGVTRYFNPVQKWQTLRLAHLALESEAWLFRTRCGKYNKHAPQPKDTEVELSGARHAEKLLGNVLRTERAAILERAAIKDTAFFKERSSHIYKHGQVRPKVVPKPDASMFVRNAPIISSKYARATDGRHVVEEVKVDERIDEAQTGRCQDSPDRDGYLRVRNQRGNIIEVHFKECQLLDDDNHHSMVDDDKYVRLRLKPAISFYQGRLPRYYVMRTAFHVGMILGSVLGVIMSAAKLSNYVAILTVTLASMTAYEEFSGVNKKLNRYSTVVASLQDLLAWWRSLDEVEKANVDKAEHLVLATEALVAGDREGWLSTSLAGKNMQKEMSRDSDVKDKKDA